MPFMPNDWDRIRVHYANWRADILRAGRNEWGGDAYDWDQGFIHMTPIEDALWEHVRACDAVLYPQFPVGRFFVDFANPVAKVAIECDGAAYHQDIEKDAMRDAQLQALGWTVYRLRGRDCVRNDDPETGEPGAARQFIQQICDAHGISRFSRVATDRSDDEWASMDDCLIDYIERVNRIRAATRQGVRL
jgi:hypothetical protein